MSREEFEVLFRSHYSDLCAYANVYLKDLEAAEELVQEVFYKLWSKRDSIEITSSMQSYLFRAVRNSSLNLIKHINIREAYKAHNEREISNSEMEHFDEVEASELEQKISKAIEELPTERRKIFVLSRYEGLKYGEIAEKLGISPKTVENQMGKALKHMREHLKEYLTYLIIIILMGMKN